MAHLLGHHGGLWHCHCGRRIAGIFGWDFPFGLLGGLPAHDRLQRCAKSRHRADFGGVVWHWCGPRHLDGIFDLVLSYHGQHRHRFGDVGARLEDVLRVLGAKRWDVLVKVGLPRSMPYFYGSLKVAITLAFVGTVLAEMTAGN